MLFGPDAAANARKNRQMAEILIPLFAAAVGSYTLGSLGYAIADAAPGPVVRPAWFDVAFVGFHPLAAAALFRMLRARVRRLTSSMWLDAVVTGRDVKRSKPDPECFLLAASKVGVDPARCVVFEDAPAGITAAKAAGMKCIAITSKGHTPERQRDADLIVPTVRDVTVAAVRALLH